MTRQEMWEEFENQLKREVHTPITMSYDDSIRLAELGIKETVARWKERLEQEPILCKECEHYYFADNRIPEQQCYVCDYWGTNNTNPTGYCNHAVRKVRG